jgi:hypothetical protein
MPSQEQANQTQHPRREGKPQMPARTQKSQTACAASLISQLPAKKTKRQRLRRKGKTPNASVADKNP